MPRAGARSGQVHHGAAGHGDAAGHQVDKNAIAIDGGLPAQRDAVFDDVDTGVQGQADCALRLRPLQYTPGLIVRVSCDPKLTGFAVSVQAPTVGGARSASGSAIEAAPVTGAGLMFPLPDQLPTMFVFAPPVVVIVPPPTILMAPDELELVYTPHPVVRERVAVHADRAPRPSDSA